MFASLLYYLAVCRAWRALHCTLMCIYDDSCVVRAGCMAVVSSVTYGLSLTYWCMQLQ